MARRALSTPRCMPDACNVFTSFACRGTGAREGLCKQSPVTGRHAETSTSVSGGGQAAQDALNFVDDQDNEMVCVECLEGVDHDKVGEERDVLDPRPVSSRRTVHRPQRRFYSTRPSEDGTSTYGRERGACFELLFILHDTFSCDLASQLLL